ncbi:MAG: type I-E CRISPR-associated protein Cas7/Cse4/CasC [Spirochaetia bacterium]|jgi:CRISPR system Cascade subunit CasC|nr:type I-E CRISPR-associated protein Cas7/Cse4/CasC [Spirochaetia bacterium]
MSEFIQLHLLTNYAPSNLNRDDLGRPKTAKMGGVDRLRISSQSLKRAWRTSEIFEESLGDRIGVRTKKFGIEVYNHFIDAGVSDSKAKKWSQEIASQFGKLKKDEKEKSFSDLEIEQLVHIAPKERAAVIALADMLVSEDRAPEKEELELLRKDIEAVDIALFGRMLASSPKYNVEAAAQVAHAITVNRITVEDDYFTAVDDLNNNEEDAGSAHIGESGFGSGVFYTYICINKTLLIENLGSEDLASKSVKALTIAAATVAPSGKQNSYASRARALYIMAEKGSQQPRQLSSAFLKPVDNTDMANAAIERIEILRTNMDKVYGSCADDFKVLNVDKAEGSLAEILEFVGA